MYDADVFCVETVEALKYMLLLPTQR